MSPRWPDKDKAPEAPEVTEVTDLPESLPEPIPDHAPSQIDILQAILVDLCHYTGHNNILHKYNIKPKTMQEMKSNG